MIPCRVLKKAVNWRAGSRYSINLPRLLRGSSRKNRKLKLCYAKLNRGGRNEKNTVSRYRPAGIRISRPCPGRDEERCSRQTCRPRIEGRAGFLERGWPQTHRHGRRFSRGQI